MHEVAIFEKVSFTQFYEDWVKHCPSDKTVWSEEEVRNIYNNIKIPQRSTKRSAGYDIQAPYNITVPLNQAKIIPTGLRCKIDDGWFLDLNPRSGQGFKYGITLANTRGIIDSDYYDADNQGHIMVKIVNGSCISKEDFNVEQGKAFCQGILSPHGIVYNDNAVGKRTGGFGSTDTNNTSDTNSETEKFMETLKTIEILQNNLDNIKLSNKVSVRIDPAYNNGTCPESSIEITVNNSICASGLSPKEATARIEFLILGYNCCKEQESENEISII